MREAFREYTEQQLQQQQGGCPMGGGMQIPAPGNTVEPRGPVPAAPPVGTMREGGEERGEKKRRSDGISRESPIYSGEPFTFGNPGKENRNPQYGRTARRGNGVSNQEFMESLMTFFSTFEKRKEYGDGDGGRNRVVLEEKHFRRMGTFSGDAGKFRSWFFDLMVCIGQVDQRLAVALEKW